MSNIVEFAFENKEVRITDQNGENWFVLRDLLEAMESKTTTTNALDSIKDGIGDGYSSDIPMPDSLGRFQNTIIIAEPAATFLLARSITEEGKRLNRFIHTEVLPSIRKIGSYSVNQQKQISHDYLSKEFKIAMEFVEMLGLDKNQAIFSANHSLKQFYNVDYLSNLNITHLISPTQQQFITPTELGSQLDLSAKTVNQKLESLGFQTATRNHKNRLTWLVTDLGKQYAQLLDTNKKHSDGTPIMQIKWDNKVVEFIK